MKYLKCVEDTFHPDTLNLIYAMFNTTIYKEISNMPDLEYRHVDTLNVLYSHYIEQKPYYDETKSLIKEYNLNKIESFIIDQQIMHQNDIVKIHNKDADLIDILKSKLPNDQLNTLLLSYSPDDIATKYLNLYILPTGRIIEMDGDL